jgi:hypothetical protein
MSLAQRQRFVRHARAYWDVHRHRVAPEVQTQLSSLRAAGRLEIIAARIVDGEQRKDAITLRKFAAVRTRSKPVLLPDWSIVPDPYMILVNRPIPSSAPCSRGAQHDPTH